MLQENASFCKNNLENYCKIKKKVISLHHNNKTKFHALKITDMKKFFYEVNCYFEGDKVAANFFTSNTLSGAKAKAQEMVATGRFARIEVSQVYFTDNEDGTTDIDASVIVESYNA